MVNPSRVRSAVLITPSGLWRPSMQRVTDELGKALSARGVSITELAPPGFGWLGRFGLIPFTSLTKKADIHHIVDHSLGHAAAFLPRRRLVISVHDLYLLREAQSGVHIPWRHLAQFKFSTRFVRKAAAIVTPTESTKTDIVEFLGIDPKRIDVVPLGVNRVFRSLEPEARALLRNKWDINGYAIVQVGNSSYKNLGAVIDTLAEVRRMGFDAELLHVGDPIGAEFLDHARSAGVEAHVRQLGRLSDEELVEIYNAGDVLLFPSSWEGMGWPPLEAMACGLPVVASDIPPIAEVTAGAALLAPHSDAKKLAENVCRFFSDSDLADEHRELGFKRVAEYDWETTADGYLRIYERLLTN